MIFSFGGYRLDDERLELTTGGEPVAVEPRVLDTLIYLVHHRDRVVSKDELLAQVWRTEHVSDAAVSRCIMEARRALGDDGEGRVIKTLHGRGYRFLPEVEELAGGTAGAGVGSPATRGTAKRRLAWAMPALVATLLVLAIWKLPRGDEPAAPRPPEERLILQSAVGGDGRQEDADLQWLAQSLEDALRLGLAEASAIELLGAPGGGPGEPEELLRAGSTAAGTPTGVIQVDVSSGDIEGFARLEVTLIRQLGSGAFEHAPLASLILPELSPAEARAGFDSIRGAVVGTVMPRLLATLDPERSSDAASRESWQLYLRSVTQWEPMCEAGASEDLLERALELEPDFVPAHIALAYTRLTQVKFCSGITRAQAELEATAESLSRVSPATATPAAFRATVLLYEGRVEEAYAVLDTVEEPLGESLGIRLGRSTALRYAGFLDESRQLFDQAVEDLPALPYVTGFVPYPHRYQGDWEAFLGLMTGQESPHFRFYRGLAEYALGRNETAITVLEPAFAAHPGDLYGRLSQALLAIVLGDIDEARVLLQQLARQRATDGGLDPEVTFEVAELMAMAGETTAGLEQLGTAVEQGFFCADCIEESLAFAALREDRALRALLGIARERQQAFAARFGPLP